MFWVYPTGYLFDMLAVTNYIRGPVVLSDAEPDAKQTQTESQDTASIGSLT